MSGIVFAADMNLCFKNPADSIRNILTIINTFRKDENTVPTGDKQKLFHVPMTVFQDRSQRKNCFCSGSPVRMCAVCIYTSL